MDWAEKENILILGTVREEIPPCTSGKQGGRQSEILYPQNQGTGALLRAAMHQVILSECEESSGFMLQSGCHNRSFLTLTGSK